MNKVTYYNSYFIKMNYFFLVRCKQLLEHNEITTISKRFNLDSFESNI